MGPLPCVLRATLWISLFGVVNALRGAKIDETVEQDTRRDQENRFSNDSQEGGYSISVVVPGPTLLPVATQPLVATTTRPQATTAEGPPVTTQPAACPITPFGTILVGGGMAGLAAAHTLKQAGVSYVLLERSERVGGRMMSADFGGQKVELGANWIVGGGRNDVVNPILALANEFGIQYYDQIDYTVTGYEQGSQTPLDEKNTEKELKNYIKALECVDAISLADWETAIASDFTSAPVDMSARDALTQCGWGQPESGSFREALEFLLMENEFLMSPDKISTYNFAEDSYYDFGPESNFVNDLRGIEFIAEEFAKSRGIYDDILFGKTVTGINYPADPNALATVSTSDCIYQAKTIIFTPSLEVTKRMETQGVFNPPLTPSSSVCPLEVHSWVKVYYKFDQTFWDKDSEWLVFGTENRGECSNWLNYDYSGQNGDIYPGTGIISCLTDQASIDASLQQEGLTELTEDFAKTKLLNPLRAAYGQVPEPTEVLITDWNDDPTSFGSWENYPKGKRLEGYYEYFQPRNNKLLLSGSGSCLRYWGFMHGAYLAGQRDAEWAIAIMNGKANPPPYSMCDDMGEF